MNIANKVLCAGLKTSCLGTTLTDEAVTTEVLARHGAQKGAMRVTKTRLKDAMESFKKLRSEARRYFNGETLPGISDDLRIIPSARLGKLQDKIAEFRSRDAELLGKLLTNYAAEIEKDRAVLGDRFDISLYPAPDALGQHFDLRLIVCDLPSGDYARVAGLDEAARAQMQKEHDAMLTQVSVAARNEVMHKLTDLIQNVADKLSNPDAKVYRESTFENLKEYLDKVQELNITNDPVIEAMRAEAATKLNLSMKVVRDSEVLKEQAAADAKAILGRFGALGNRKLVA
jgi:hypothetical protein